MDVQESSSQAIELCDPADNHHIQESQGLNLENTLPQIHVEENCPQNENTKMMIEEIDDSNKENERIVEENSQKMEVDTLGNVELKPKTEEQPSSNLKKSQIPDSMQKEDKKQIQQIQSTPSTMNSSGQQTPFYPHFLIKNIPIALSLEEVSNLIANELKSYGQIAKLELSKETEELRDIFIGLAHDKDAVLSLKSPIQINFGDTINPQVRLLEPTSDFKKYLTNLSTSLKLQAQTSKPKENMPKPVVISGVLKQASPKKANENKNTDVASNLKAPEVDPKKIIIKGSKKSKVPLEIVKPNKQLISDFSLVDKSRTNRHLQKSQSRSRSRSETFDPDKEVGMKFARRKFTEDQTQYSRNRRKDSENSLRKTRETRHEKDHHVNGRKEKGRKEDYKGTVLRESGDDWTDDEDEFDLVRYLVGIPLGYDEYHIKELLIKEGYSDNVRMRWKEFEGLEYLKITFKSHNDSQRFLRQSIIIQDIPIIILPKLFNKTPLEMLSYHQLRITSLNGSIESRTLYEFLLKFGLITDFVVLDSLENPTTFFVTFTTNLSKKQLVGYYPNNQAVLMENNQEYLLHFEFNVKPSLVNRKKPYQSIIYPLKETELKIQAVINNNKLNEDIFTNPEVSSPSIKSYHTQTHALENPSPNFVSPLSSHQGFSFNLQAVPSFKSLSPLPIINGKMNQMAPLNNNKPQNSFYQNLSSNSQGFGNLNQDPRLFHSKYFPQIEGAKPTVLSNVERDSSCDINQFFNENGNQETPPSDKLFTGFPNTQGKFYTQLNRENNHFLSNINNPNSQFYSY